ncbi:TPA: hypothetical protein ACOBM9_002645 [Enterococcus faecium]
MKKIFGVSVGLLMMLTFGNAVYAAEKEVISDPEQSPYVRLVVV